MIVRIDVVITAAMTIHFTSDLDEMSSNHAVPINSSLPDSLR